MKQVILASAFFLMCQFSFAQYDNFDLSKYKLPDIKRHQLDLRFNSSGGFVRNYVINDNEYLRDTADNQDNKFGGNLIFQYSYYRSSPQIQSSARTFFSTSYNNYKQTSIGQASKSEYSNTALEGEYDLRYFLPTKNWFIRGVPKASLSYTGNSNESSERKYFSTSESFLLGFGKGRVEQVQDFRHAILILENLEKRGLTKRELNENEILELAILISRLKNERFFDSRIKMESDMEAIDSLLEVKDVIGVSNIQYFSSLNDMWRYGDMVVRESGNQLELSIKPGYLFRNRDLDHDYSDEDMIEEDFSIDYDLSFSSYNPLSIKWQADYRFGLSHRFTNELQNIYNDFAQKYYRSNLYLSGSLGYFPNTRTSLYLSTNLNLQNQSFNEDKKIDKDRYELQCLFQLDAYYYISERLRLNASLSTLNIYGGLFNSSWGYARNHQYNYNLTLNYAIF